MANKTAGEKRTTTDLCLTYIQEKTKPYLLKAFEWHRQKPLAAWQIYRYIAENMVAAPSFNTMEKLIKKMLDGGELSKEWDGRGWEYSMVAKGQDANRSDCPNTVSLE